MAQLLLYNALSVNVEGWVVGCVRCKGEGGMRCLCCCSHSGVLIGDGEEECFVCCLNLPSSPLRKCWKESKIAFQML